MNSKVQEEEASARGKFGVVFLICFAWTVWALIALLLPALPQFWAKKNGYISTYEDGRFMYLLFFPLATFICIRILAPFRVSWKDFGPSWQDVNILKLFWIVPVCGAIAMGIGALTVSGSSERRVYSTLFLGKLLHLVSNGIVVPFCEEVFWHGYMLTAARKHLGSVFGFFLINGLFTVDHFVSDLGFERAALVFVFGAFCIAIRLRYGLWYAMLTHSTLNFLATGAALWIVPLLNLRT